MLNLLATNKFRLTAIALTLGVVGIANADEVRLAGNTKGAFDAQAFGSTNTLGDLSYSGSTFDNTTVGGMLNFGGDPTPGTNFNNLGSLTIGVANQVYTGHTFKIQVNFTAPTTITGGSSTVFTSVLSGTLSNGLGGVFVDFDNTPQTFVFSNGNTSGSFTFTVNDTSLAPSSSASITAHITGSQSTVPEASSLAGMTAGLLGMFGLIRRRK